MKKALARSLWLVTLAVWVLVTVYLTSNNLL